MHKIRHSTVGYLLALVFATPLIISCSSSTPQQEKKTRFPLWHTKDKNAFNLLISQFAHNIEEIWGHSEVVIAGPKDYIKYSSDYQTRTHINFEKGTITFETLSVPMAQAFL